MRVCSCFSLRYLCDHGGFAWEKEVSRKAAKNAKEEIRRKDPSSYPSIFLTACPFLYSLFVYISNAVLSHRKDHK